MRLYLSGAFTGVEDLDRRTEFYEDVSRNLESYGYLVYKPHEKTGPINGHTHSNSEVYKTDISEINESNVLISILDGPSHGVGAEIYHSMAKNKLVLGFYRDKEEVSRFILGLLEEYEMGFHFSYENASEIGDISNKVIRNILTSVTWTQGELQISS